MYILYIFEVFYYLKLMKENEQFENFKAYLQKTQKKNLHFLFFQKDTRISSIKVPILKKSYPQQILNPYRNINCLKPSCIYDSDELLSQYKICQKTHNPNFICKNCQQLITFTAFFCDLTLKALIEKIWNKYNKPEQIVCNEVKIYRNGSCKPIISEYLKQVQRNFIENFGKDEEKNTQLQDLEENFFRVPAFRENNEGVLKFTLKYGIFPKLTEFTKEEYNKLQIELSEKKMNDPLLERYGNIIFVKDFINFKEEASFPINLMTFFLLYLQDLQKNNPQLYNPEEMNRGLFLGFRIRKYENFYKNLNYEIFFGMRNIYLCNPRLICSNFDLVFLVILLDDRYFLSLVDLRKQNLHIVNFLERDLDNNQDEEYIEISKLICQKELGLKSLKISFYEKKKFNFYNDFGLFVAIFI